MVKKTSLASRFRTFRESQGWRVRDIEDCLLIHRQTWLKWERAEQSPPAAARALLISLECAANAGELETVSDKILENWNWFGKLDE